MNHSEEFKQAIRSFGLIPPDVIVPDKFQRFPGIGKHKGNSSGWCIFFNDGLGGMCGDFASDMSEIWQAEREKPWTPEERQERIQRAEEPRKKAEAESKQEADNTAKQSLVIWRNAKPCTTHAYCEKKRIEPYPARVISAQNEHCKKWFWTTNDNGDLVELVGNLLILPLYNIDGELRGLQAIDVEGRKSLIRGLGKRGLFIPITGGKLPADYAGKLYIGEGFSTVRTAREATNNPAIASIDAYNLLHVAQAWRKKCPQAEIIICGD